jgi:pimeloyl-ACP methyl ester carboxylesterase
VADVAYYLGGDSYPADADAEQALCDRLRPGLPRLVPQRQWQGPDPLPKDPAVRLARLAAAVGDAADVVLIGRSSGGRVATRFASLQKVRAVVCLAYPFAPPTLVLDPDRFTHLAELAVPTLILQGTLDSYGALEITERYRLSAAVRLCFLPGVRHGFALSGAGWDRVAAMVLDFLAMPAHPPAPAAEDFDEADYLHRYPPVAEAVAAGRVKSGHMHYLRNGRREGRRYRLRPLAGSFAAAE